MSEIYKVAALQAESAWFDLEGGVEKTCRLILETGATGAQVVGFPVSPVLLLPADLRKLLSLVIRSRYSTK